MQLNPLIAGYHFVTYIFIISFRWVVEKQAYFFFKEGGDSEK